MYTLTKARRHYFIVIWFPTSNKHIFFKNEPALRHFRHTRYLQLDSIMAFWLEMWGRGSRCSRGEFIAKEGGGWRGSGGRDLYRAKQRVVIRLACEREPGGSCSFLSPPLHLPSCPSARPVYLFRALPDQGGELGEDEVDAFQTRVFQLNDLLFHYGLERQIWGEQACPVVRHHGSNGLMVAGMDTVGAAWAVTRGWGW